MATLFALMISVSSCYQGLPMDRVCERLMIENKSFLKRASLMRAATVDSLDLATMARIYLLRA